MRQFSDASLNRWLIINHISLQSATNERSLLQRALPLCKMQKLPVTGQRQSPIDIRPSYSIINKQKRTESDSAGIPPLTIDYSAITGAEGLSLENTGHGWKLNIADEVAARCPISGGPLATDEYRLLQVHSHWGKNSLYGSEHTVEGRAYACEVHLVHWNATKYESAAQAMECASDGLAVVGVFIQIPTKGPAKLEPLNQIIAYLPQILFKGDKVALPDTSALELNQLIPNRLKPKYYNYLGSLTTPPYCESVIWILMEQPIDAQEEQIAQFRFMNKNDSTQAEVSPVKENFRKVQPLHNRYISFFS